MQYMKNAISSEFVTDFVQFNHFIQKLNAPNKEASSQ